MTPFVHPFLPRRNKKSQPVHPGRDEGLTHDLLLKGRRAFRDSVIGDDIGHGT
ncbi:hypothetical protein [Staphylospora marina]|uniref:hypothetical protein n=1 Tax=Staphylospora marina TaxID=2490858 RepID=UPI0013DE26F2|nr:hypothetical protein [Staphylospora marina]